MVANFGRLHLHGLGEQPDDHSQYIYMVTTLKGYNYTVPFVLLLQKCVILPPLSTVYPHNQIGLLGP